MKDSMRVAAVLLASCAAAAAQTTWIVDDTPGVGVDFTSLPVAVGAAASGDTLLVAAGSYEPFQVVGKALTIRGADSSAVLIDQPPALAGTDYVAIDAVPAGQVFRLSGVTVRRSHPHRLMLRGSGALTGAVVLDGVVSESATGGAAPADGPGLHVRGVLVHANRCTIRGGANGQLPFAVSGYIGVIADTGAVLSAQDCTFFGGMGVSFVQSFASGGAGLRVADATCRLSGCSVFGGLASVMAVGGLTLPGAGVQVVGSSEVTVAGDASDSLEAGWNGGSSSIGASGIDSSLPASVVVHGPVAIAGSGGGPPTTGSGITLGQPALPGLEFAGATLPNGALPAAQQMTLSLDGTVAGGLFVLLVDTHPGATPLPVLSDEPLLLGSTTAIASFALLDASGAYSLTVVPATQLAFTVGRATHWQAFVWDPATARWRGSNAALLRVES